MSFTSLASYLAAASSHHAALVIAKYAHHSIAQLLLAAQRLPLRVQDRGDAIILRIADPLKMLVALLALDGRIRRILLLSSALPDDQASSLMKKFGPAALLTDSPIFSSSAGTVTRWLEPISQIETELPVRGGEAEKGATARGRANADRPLPADKETVWTIATSGTTSEPKLVMHDLNSLTGSVRKPGVGVSDLRWGQLYDMSRFSGVQLLLQGLLGGGSLILTPHEESLKKRIEILADAGCNALSATPTLWRKILMTPGAERLKLEQVTLGGEIADEAVLNALRQQFVGARITHIYASTEAGTGFSVKDGKAGFPASFLDEPPAGVRIKVDEGRLYLDSDRVAKGYVAAQFPGRDDEGFIFTGDIVERIGDRYHFRGRENGAINVGGNKAFPEEIEGILLEHEAVTSAKVYGRDNPLMGQLVVADVVTAEPASDQKQLANLLKAYCRERLQAWQVPASIQFVDTVAISPTGKLDRRVA